jgi:hypothetical protein
VDSPIVLLESRVRVAGVGIRDPESGIRDPAFGGLETGKEKEKGEERLLSPFSFSVSKP